MAPTNPITTIMLSLGEYVACSLCETRLRFGDMECPHCGADVEEVLQQWAQQLLSNLGQETP